MTSLTSLGIPGLSGQSAGLAPRRKTRQFKLGNVGSRERPPRVGAVDDHNKNS